MRALSPAVLSVVAFVALVCGSACGRSVNVGRYPSDGGDGGDGGDSSSDAGDSGGVGGSGGTSGDGGDGGHDECAETEPVCGSDHRTYMNPCLALRAGVSIVSRGACR